MRTRDAFGELLEEWHHDLLELDGLDDVEYLLEFVEEHDLLGTVRLGPELEQAADDLLGETGILFEELDDAVGELRMIDAEQLGFVQRQEHLDEKVLVLVLER